MSSKSDLNFTLSVPSLFLAHTHTREHTHAHTRMHTAMHTHTHAHTHACTLSFTWTHADPNSFYFLPLSLSNSLSCYNTHYLYLFPYFSLCVCSCYRTSIVLGATSWGASGDTLWKKNYNWLEHFNG